MPYKIRGKCVHKVNDDGSLGPVVPGGCHKSRTEARAHQKALYENVRDAKKGVAAMGDTVTMTSDNGTTKVFHEVTTNTTNTPAPTSVPAPTPATFDFAAMWPSGYAPIRLYFAEGERTVDNRVIDPNAMNFNRQPPLPLRLQTRQPESGGHAGAELSGVILNLARDGHVIIADGFLDLSLEAGRQMAQLAHNQTLQTWAPDIGDATIDVEENYTDEDANTPQDSVAHVRSCTLIGCTAVALPALGGAMFELLNEDGSVMVAAPHREGPQINPAGVSTDPEERKVITERLMASKNIAACAGPQSPPAEWFSNPNLTELSQFLTITADGHVYGHLCPWDACHIGYQGMCVTPPREDDYSYFRIGQVQTADGTLVATGPIALHGGHASRNFSADKAQAHYDNPDSAIMDVAVGPDDHGIWFSGALRPDVTPAQVRKLQASGVSGDWREIDGQLRLIGICSVNVPGFPKVRLTASGEDEPRVTALVGMGTNPELTNCPTCEDYTIEQELTDLHEEIAALHELVASMQSSSWDVLETRASQATDPFLELASRAGIE